MKYNARPYIDHLGNSFQSEKELLEHYNIAKTTFRRKLQQHIPLDEILTKYQRKSTVQTDHLGNEFKTITAMLDFYNVSESVYLYGIKNNIPLETILTKVRHNSTDHTGQTFKTMRDMCDYWGISINIVKRRLKDGWSLEQALTEPPHRPFSFPAIVYKDIVKKHITIKKHIDNEYFLCKLNDKDIIMSKQAIIALANDIYQTNKERN